MVESLIVCTVLIISIFIAKHYISIINNNSKMNIKTPKSTYIKSYLFGLIPIVIVVLFLLYIGFTTGYIYVIIIIAIPLIFLVLSCHNFSIIIKNKKKKIEIPKSVFIKAILFGIIFLIIVTIYYLFILLLLGSVANM